MKEKYVKPVIMIERFTLTQSIAENCGSSAVNNVKHNHADAYSCAWVTYDGTIFLDGMNVCEDQYTDPSEVEFLDYCYNNPEPGLSMFGSV